MGEGDVEICANCGREIPQSEQAYIFKREIVCKECDAKLRIGSELWSVDLSELGSASADAAVTSRFGENARKTDIWKEMGLDHPEVPARHQMEKKEAKPSQPEAHEQEEKKTWSVGKSVGIIFAGCGLCVLGVGLVVFAVWWFLQERGSFLGTAMACGVIGVAVASFKTGIAVLGEAGSFLRTLLHGRSRK